METRKIPTLEEIQSTRTTPAHFWGYSTDSRGMPIYCEHSSEEEVRDVLYADYERILKDHPHAKYPEFSECIKVEPVARNPKMHGLRLCMKPTSFK